ncbi:MAG TPA: tyrosine-type recombinase/integrase, partial [Byssovorax sp.]
YSLRHFAITSWLRRGIPATTVMIIAGHSNLSTTQRYAHVLGLDIAEAARVIRAASITHPAAE